MHEMVSTSGPLVDWIGLLKVFSLSLLFAIGVVVLLSFTIGFWANSLRTAGVRKLVDLSLMAIGLLLVLGVVGFGISTMLTK